MVANLNNQALISAGLLLIGCDGFSWLNKFCPLHQNSWCLPFNRLALITLDSRLCLASLEPIDRGISVKFFEPSTEK